MTSYADVTKAESKFLPKLKKLIGKVPFARDALAMYFAMLDQAVPLWAKLTIALALVYFIVPTDVIPDYLLGVGYIDDAGIIAAALKTVDVFVSESHFKLADQWFRSHA